MLSFILQQAMFMGFFMRVEIKDSQQCQSWEEHGSSLLHMHSVK